MRCKLQFRCGPLVFRAVFFYFLFLQNRLCSGKRRHLAVNVSGLYAIEQVGVPRDVEVISGVSL
jgi:hypothetical protein